MAVSRTVTPQILNIAHRGARSLAPENTMAAARKALEVGAEMWELDVGLTLDGVPILIHDDTLERTSNVDELFPERRPWKVHEFTLEEIRSLDFGSWFNEEDPFGTVAEGAVSAEEQESYRGETAPTLEEALRFTRDHDWRVNVEIKDLSGTAGDETVVEQVVGIIEELEMVERVIVSSFNHDYLRRVRAANPGIATGALVTSPPRDPVALVEELQAEAYHPYAASTFPAHVRALRDAGYDVYVWTVNDEQTMRDLIQHGVSGLFTDFPQTLSVLLDEMR